MDLLSSLTDTQLCILLSVDKKYTTHRRVAHVDVFTNTRSPRKKSILLDSETVAKLLAEQKKSESATAASSSATGETGEDGKTGVKDLQPAFMDSRALLPFPPLSPTIPSARSRLPRRSEARRSRSTHVGESSSSEEEISWRKSKEEFTASEALKLSLESTSRKTISPRKRNSFDMGSSAATIGSEGGSNFVVSSSTENFRKIK